MDGLPGRRHDRGLHVFQPRIVPSRPLLRRLGDRFGNRPGGRLRPGGTTGAPHLADVTGQPAGLRQGTSQQHLDLGVGTAQIIGRPPGHRVMDSGVQPQENFLALGRHTTMLAE